jgi:hypothetical protein
MSDEDWDEPVRRIFHAEDEALDAGEALIAIQDHLDENGADAEAMHALAVLTSVVAYAREAVTATGVHGSAPDSRRALKDLDAALDGRLT